MKLEMMLFMEDYIREKMSDPALYEQLAEESVELAHACMKMARLLRGESPTPEQEPKVKERVIEELADVLLVTKIMRLKPMMWQMEWKLKRWADRLKIEWEETNE